MYKFKSAKYTKLLSQIKICLKEKEKNIFKWSELNNIVFENRNYWRLNQSASFNALLDFLLEKEVLKEYIFKFPSRAEKRYVFGESSENEILLSINSASYFSHFSAMILNKLTEKPSDIYYLNVEQDEKKILNGKLIQENINRAFQNNQRISKNIATFENKKICLLNGKYTGLLGVRQIENSKNEILKVTDIERTLIDITVRPSYSGGITEVLFAYKNSKGRVSIDKIVEYLEKVDYTYPYHQAIGFYLCKSGVYLKEEIEKLKKFKIKFDFYLSHNMGRDISFSKEWRLYYPNYI